MADDRQQYNASQYENKYSMHSHQDQALRLRINLWRRKGERERDKEKKRGESHDQKRESFTDVSKDGLLHLQKSVTFLPAFQNTTLQRWIFRYQFFRRNTGM